MPPGRKFGQPVGPSRAAGGGRIPAMLPSAAGLQMPIQRQYWTGMGWSRPHDFLNASRISTVIRGFWANFAVAPPGAARRIAYTAMLMPKRTGTACATRRTTYFVIGSPPVVFEKVDQR